jgi:5-methylcytosine-specific restriction endonuclease McrA
MFDGHPISPVPGPHPDDSRLRGELLITTPEHERELRALEHELTRLSANLNAAEYRFAVLLEEFHRRGGHVGVGIKSCAHWLNWRCGISLGAAREKVRVALALPGLPGIAQAFSTGELSFSKVRAMTRVATTGNEARLLELARTSTASQLERVVHGYRRAERNAEAQQAERQHARRELRCYYDEDGSLVIRGRLPPELGALVLKALEAAGDGLPLDGGSEAQPEEDVSAEMFSAAAAADEAHVYAGIAPTPPAVKVASAEDPLAARQADALVCMAESFLAHGAGALAGGERYQVMVHVDADTLPMDGAGLRCDLEDGPGVSAETARRLACDASRVCVHEDPDGNVLDIGRRSRQIPPAIARALRLRDRGCRFPGCTQRRFVDGHHIVHWADGGPTSLDNLVLLCRHHHRAVHEEGFRVERVARRLEFFTPRGKHIPPAPSDSVTADTGALSLARQNVQRGLRIGALTGVTHWRGEALHLGAAVGSLLELK